MDPSAIVAAQFIAPNAVIRTVMGGEERDESRHYAGIMLATEASIDAIPVMKGNANRDHDYPQPSGI